MCSRTTRSASSARNIRTGLGSGTAYLLKHGVPVATLKAMSNPSHVLRIWEHRRSHQPSGRTGALPPANARRSRRWQSLPLAPPEASAPHSATSSHLRFLFERGAGAPRLRGLQVTFLVELRHVVRHAIGQQLRADNHQLPVIAGAMVDQRLHELGRYERGIAGLRKHVPQQFQELLAGHSLGQQPRTDPG